MPDLPPLESGQDREVLPGLWRETLIATDETLQGNNEKLIHQMALSIL